ncbi:HAD family hydrolase [Persicirhabdus sediminis]|uniref:Haloacid dehalogenase-like hydrolase n=1 Tax=Persicirhabdus sediminis TaxID=454144 RepID=A0A8J7SJD0_9BACT|nr:haloacid dehalogenase-like hydrolase [Persicirhabdus sediminis]MBK1792060.1 haloacid dehalogenase-like hydrolase [Persicirhabdus sediminis]
MKILANIASLVFTLLVCKTVTAGEDHTTQILSEIENNRQLVMEQAGPAGEDSYIFLAFWDFDGTILHGDCSEGLVDDGTVIYQGLAQLVIESGHSKIYPVDGGFDRFWKDYRHMEHTISEWLAYPFIAQMMWGADTAKLEDLCARHFREQMSPHYFSSSMEMMNHLESLGIKNHVISASADVFVTASAETLPIDRSRMNGIKLKINDGVLSEEIIYPVTWAEGKTTKLKEIVAEVEAANPGKQVVVLAAFGNSYGTDGAFMKFVAQQQLPAGKATAVMINGGDEPAEYRGLFTCVQQTATQGDNEKPNVR